MAICPIISKPDNLSDCIAEACPFFEGCMILEAYNASNDCDDRCDSLQEDVDAAWAEANGVRIDHDDLVRALNSLSD